MNDSHHRCVIAIPLYKRNPDELEIVSLRQCLKVFRNYQIVFFTHSDVETFNYDSILSENHFFNYRFEYFDKDYFKSIEGYNKLMLSRRFYQRFTQYDYLLIYQLDAYVFSDELEQWCSQGYDYIGAPWVKLNYRDNKISSHFFKGVGNGGFSLRKVDSHLKFLNRLDKIQSLINRLIRRIPFFSKTKLISLLSKELYLNLLLRKLNEDSIFYFFSFVVCKFKIPKPKLAINFSMELEPEYLFNLNSGKLPFGCHARWKYDYTFWSQFISEAKPEVIRYEQRA